VESSCQRTPKETQGGGGKKGSRRLKRFAISDRGKKESEGEPLTQRASNTAIIASEELRRGDKSGGKGERGNHLNIKKGKTTLSNGQSFDGKKQSDRGRKEGTKRGRARGRFWGSKKSGRGYEGTDRRRGKG